MEWYHVWWPWMTSKRVARFVSDSWVSCLYCFKSYYVLCYAGACTSVFTVFWTWFGEKQRSSCCYAQVSSVYTWLLVCCWEMNLIDLYRFLLWTLCAWLWVNCVYCANREGIQFVMNTQSYPFLEILCEFSGKLMKQDKKVVYVGFLISFCICFIWHII